jgi:hypothetical protein
MWQQWRRNGSSSKKWLRKSAESENIENNRKAVKMTKTAYEEKRKLEACGLK